MSAVAGTLGIIFLAGRTLPQTPLYLHVPRSLSEATSRYLALPGRVGQTLACASAPGSLKRSA
jgi:hypothetical protein